MPHLPLATVTVTGTYSRWALAGLQERRPGLCCEHAGSPPTWVRGSPAAGMLWTCPVIECMCGDIKLWGPGPDAHVNPSMQFSKFAKNVFDSVLLRPEKRRINSRLKHESDVFFP